MRRLDDALATVRKELADVGIGPVGGVGIEPLSRTLDIWFDNIFSDFSAQSRIKDAQRRLGGLVDVLGEVDAELGRRLVAARAQLEA